jgi:hypothetical protein
VAKKMKKLRGTIRPLVKPFPPVGRMHWRKQKTLAMLDNRRQWQREFEPTQTAGIEIEMEHLTGYYLITEASTTDPDITWITTE